MPIYGKNPLKILFSRTKKYGILKLGLKLCWLQAYQVCSNDNSMLTFDLSRKRSVWYSSAFIWKKYWKVNFLQNWWRLMYYIWQTHFINVNISMSRLICNRQPYFKVTWLFIFKGLQLWSPRASCDHISYLASWGLEKLKFVQMVPVCKPRWQPYPYMVKILRKSSRPEPRNLESWNLIYYLWLKAYHFCSNVRSVFTFDLSTKKSVWLSYAFLWDWWRLNLFNLLGLG